MTPEPGAATDLVPAPSGGVAAPGALPAGSGQGRAARAGTWIARGAIVVVAVLVLGAAWFAFRAWQATSALQDARSTVESLGSGVGVQDASELEARLPGLQVDLARARRATADPIWSVAGLLPVVGDDVRAVRTVSRGLAAIADTSLPAVTALADAITLQPAADGHPHVDVAALSRATPALTGADAAARDAADAIGAIATDRLVGQLAGPVRDAQSATREIASTLDTASQFVPLLPAMLGADGPRTYLLLSLNSAELRAQGGIPGAFTVLHVEDGALTVVGHKSTIDLPPLDAPVLPLSAEELDVQSERLGTSVQNTMLTPDFPRAAELVTAIWQREGGGPVDGVVATDPVAASYLLEATGPVTATDGSTVTASDLVRSVLHDAYVRYPDPADGDSYYAGVATSIFDAVTAGHADESTLASGLERAVREGRVRIWSAHPDEQAALAGSSVGAAFLGGGHDGDAGVFLDDATRGKVDYYLDARFAITHLRCAGPTPTATVGVTLAYDAPASIASASSYVTGPRSNGFPRGDLALRMSVYAPAGVDLATLRSGGTVVSGAFGTLGGRQVQAIGVVLQPGQSVAYSFDVPIRDGGVTVWTTPTISNPGSVRARC